MSLKKTENQPTETMKKATNLKKLTFDQKFCLKKKHNLKRTL